MSSYIDMENEEEDESINEQAEMIYSREEISSAMNFDPELRSKRSFSRCELGRF
jgi:hypothetical protein